MADSGYLKSLSLPNIALNFDGIEQIVENGILTKTGKTSRFLVVLRNVMFFLGKAKYYHSILSSMRQDSSGSFILYAFKLGSLTIITHQDDYPVHVKGLNGTTIQGYYDAHGGPTGYCGTTIPDIPNFYMLAGTSHVKPTRIAHYTRQRRPQHRHTGVHALRRRSPSL